MDIDRAIKVAELWKAGKMIGEDEDEVRDALLAEVKKHRVGHDTPKTWTDSFGYKRHLVSECLDGEKHLVVSKYWARSKQRWKYACEERWMVDFQIDIQKTSKNN